MGGVRVCNWDHTHGFLYVCICVYICMYKCTYIHVYIYMWTTVCIVNTVEINSPVPCTAPIFLIFPSILKFCIETRLILRPDDISVSVFILCP